MKSIVFYFCKQTKIVVAFCRHSLDPSVLLAVSNKLTMLASSSKSEHMSTFAKRDVFELGLFVVCVKMLLVCFSVCVCFHLIRDKQATQVEHLQGMLSSFYMRIC